MEASPTVTIPADISDALLASLADRRAERLQLDRIEWKLNAICKAIGGPLRDLDLSEPRYVMSEQSES